MSKVLSLHFPLTRWLIDWLIDGQVRVLWCGVEGFGDVVLSNDAAQVPARHADVSNDVWELWVSRVYFSRKYT